MKNLKKVTRLYSCSIVLTLVTTVMITTFFAYPVAATNLSEDLAYNEVMLSATPLNGGFLSGDGIYKEGKEINLIAEESDEYYFTGWVESDEIISTDSNLSLTVTENRNLLALFENISKASNDKQVNLVVQSIPNTHKFRSPLTGDLTVNQTYHTAYGNRAIDFRAAEGTAVYAVGDGVVDLTSTGGGSWCRLQLDNSDISVWYVHTYRWVASGTHVNKGQKIAEIAPQSLNGGYPPHLHLGLSWKSGSGQSGYPNLMNYMRRDITYRPMNQEVLNAWFDNWTTINWNKVAWNPISSENHGYADLSYLKTDPPPSTPLPGPMSSWPSKSEFLNTEDVVIQWSNSSNATDYGLTVVNDSTGQVVHNSYHTGNSANIGKLVAGTYRFNMRGRNSAGHGPVSELKYFTIKTAPPPGYL